MIALKGIAAIARETPEEPAIVDGPVVMSWRQLEGCTRKKIAFLLAHYGKDLPKQALYISKNRVELVPWLSAFATLGVPISGLDYTLSLQSLSSLIEKTGATLLLMSSTLWDHRAALDRLAPESVLKIDLDSVTQSFFEEYSYSAQPESALSPEQGYALQSYRALGFTSGTTGLPKAVLRTKSFDPRRFAYFTATYGFNRRDRYLLCMPLYHAAGNGWARLFLSLGATIFIADLDCPGILVEAMVRHEITTTTLTPVMLSRLLDHIETAVLGQPAALRWVLVGGKHFPVPLKSRALSVLGSCVHEYYGTTETGVNTIADPRDIELCPGSVGRAYDGNKIIIIDADGKIVPNGVPGAVAIHSYMSMDRYLDGDMQRRTIDGLEYLVTPELGYLDDDGRLFLLNRTADTRQTAHLYRLEDSIRALPCVADVAIVSGEGAPHCALSLIKGRLSTDQAVLARVQRLAEAEDVRFERMAILPSIPYSPSGKVRVQDLEALLA
ncbi:AMP-binding protein [Caldimonas brevitalea]|uniref:Long-chain-fatty-acid--CoA ligase n=1 Tax=Caldimonas brevitalea TaxID=413882 RepID=A0A0G3BN34_9BURK|nr:AMP-binding protein [Caldimonas brevitalea]AKJ30812.1 long-chain-fatty-acid--CoA ligase [Caldimonas brevitalea]